MQPIFSFDDCKPTACDERRVTKAGQSHKSVISHHHFRVFSIGARESARKVGYTFTSK
jgi:hypothetical protein